MLSEREKGVHTQVGYKSSRNSLHPSPLLYQVSIQYGDKENSYMTQRGRDYRTTEKKCAQSAYVKLQKMQYKGKAQSNAKVVGSGE